MTAPAVRNRAQVVDQLVAGRREGRWRYLGSCSPGEYAVEVTTAAGPVGRQHDVAGMSAWLDGWAAGTALVPLLDQLPANAQVPQSVRMLLNCPGVLDQRRIRVAHAMERHGWTYADIAGALRAQRSTVRGLLRYGSSPPRVTKTSRKLAEVEALLPELARGYGRRPGPLPGLARIEPLATARPEPAELRRARALALSIEAGLLSGWSPLDVTELRSARVAEVTDVAGRTYVVRVAGLIPWCQGVADGAAAASTGWPPAAREQVAVLARALS